MSKCALNYVTFSFSGTQYLCKKSNIMFINFDLYILNILKNKGAYYILLCFK